MNIVYVISKDKRGHSSSLMVSYTSAQNCLYSSDETKEENLLHISSLTNWDDVFAADVQILKNVTRYAL